MLSAGSRNGNVDKYTALSRRLIRQAQEEFDKGDRLQASEKAWGAAAHAVKAAAEQRGWRHDSHARLFHVVSRISREADDSEFLALFQVANSMHQNFYEDWQTDEFVQDGIERIELLVQKMGALSR